MPVVPRLNEVQSQPIRSPGFSNNEVVNQIGQAAQSAGQVFRSGEGLALTAESIAEKEYQKANQTVNFDARNQLVKEKNELFYNPEKGALVKRGKDSFGVVDQYGELFELRKDELRAGLTNDTQRAQFDSDFSQINTEFNNMLQSHVAGEAQKFERDTIDSGKTNAIVDGSLNYAQPGKIQESLGMIKYFVDYEASVYGIDPTSEKYEDNLRNEQSKLHSSVISRMINHDQDRLATEYLGQYKDQFTDKDYIYAEKLVEAGSTAGEAQRFVDNVMAQNVSKTEAYNMAKDTFEDSPKVRDAVEQRINYNYTALASAKIADEEATYERMSSFIYQTKGLGNIPQDQVLALSSSHKKALEADRIHALNGTEGEHNSEKFYELQQLAPRDPDSFLKENLRLYRSEMSTSNWNELFSTQKSMREKDGKADVLLSGYRTDAEIVNSTLNAIGIDPSPKQGTPAAKNVNLFRQRVDEQVLLLQQQSGKKVNSQQIQEIADELAGKVITDKGFFWDTKKRAFELETGQDFSINMDDVPRAERIKIEDVLRKNKLPISDKSIIELYSRKLKGTLSRGR